MPHHSQAQKQPIHNVLEQEDEEQARIERIKKLESLLENERSILQNQKNLMAPTNHESCDDYKLMSKLAATGVHTQPTPATVSTQSVASVPQQLLKPAAEASRTTSHPVTF